MLETVLTVYLLAVFKNKLGLRCSIFISGRETVKTVLAVLSFTHHRAEARCE
jgi:hypothetical protein